MSTQPDPRSPDTLQAWAELTNRRRDESRDWSALHAAKDAARFTPEQASRLGLSEADYINVYYEAWVGGGEHYAAVRYKGGGSPAHKRWLVNFHRAFPEAEHDERYGKQLDA